MSWLKRERTGIKGDKRERSDLPEGLWTKCEGCGEALFQSVLEENLWTCPKCDHHFRVPARTYLGYLVDDGSFEERFENLVAGDPLEFRDAKMRYPDRLAAAQRDTGLKDAAIAGPAYGLGLYGGTHSFSLAREDTFRRVRLALIAVSVLMSLPVWN